MAHHNLHITRALKLSRALFLIGLVVIAGAAALHFIIANAALAMMFVLIGLLFVAVGLTLALIHATTQSNVRKPAVNNDTTHVSADYSSVAEILFYLLFG